MRRAKPRSRTGRPMRLARGRQIRFVGYAIIALAWWLSACDGQPPSETAPIADPPRLVLLYAPCTVSTLHLSPYEADVEITPRLATFAASGVTFEHHRTEAGSSGIAYASLLSGTQADQHGIVRHPAALDDRIKLIAELYAQAGYETYYWNGQPMAARRLNYGQGVKATNSKPVGLMAGDPMMNKLLRGLANDPERRAFVMTNFTLSHGPYSSEGIPEFLAHYPAEKVGTSDASRDYLIRLYQKNALALAYNFDATLERLGISPEVLPDLIAAVRLAYRSNIWRLDRAFGELMDEVDRHGLTDESLVAFTADHGEVLHREDARFKFTHSSSLAPEVLDVPLIIRAPGLSPSRYEGVSRSIDVFPTLVGLSGMNIDTTQLVAGEDLSRFLSNSAAPKILSAYSHTALIPTSVFVRMQRPGGHRTWGERMRIYPTDDIAHMEVALRRGDYTYKLRSLNGHTFIPEAFNRTTDRWESHDILDLAHAEHQEAIEALHQYKARLIASLQTPALDNPEQSHTQDDYEDALRALGYIE